MPSGNLRTSQLTERLEKIDVCGQRGNIDSFTEFVLPVPERRHVRATLVR